MVAACGMKIYMCRKSKHVINSDFFTTLRKVAKMKKRD